MVNKIFSACLGFLFIVTTLAYAQPRVEEDRPLDRAVRDARSLYERGLYAAAVSRVEAAIDSAGPGENRLDALELLAKANFESGRYREALVAGRDYLYRLPAPPETDTAEPSIRALEILYIRAVSAYQQGAIDEANGSFAALANVATEENMARRLAANYWLARTHADRGRLDSAEHYVVHAIPAEGRPATDLGDDAIYLLAWIHEGRDDIDSAASLYQRIVNEYPTGEIALDAQLRLGVIEARRGHPESAVTLLNSLTTRSSRQREEQLFYLAEASAALDRNEDALRYHTQFLREFPDSRRVRLVRYGVGWSQLRLRRWDEALASFRQLDEGIDSIAAAAAYQIGAIQTMRGDTAGAVGTFEKLLYRLPYESFSDNAYYQLGRIFYRRGQYDSARYYLRYAAQQFPESDVRTDARYLLAESYTGLGDLVNAQYNFQATRRAGAFGDLYRRALYREGLVLYRLGRFASAIDRLREYAAEHQAGDEIADATFWLGEALYQDRKFDEAERYLSTLVERYPNSGWREQAIYGLAWARFQQKDFKGAAQTFTDFIKQYPTSDNLVDATLRLADAYRFMRDYGKAIEIYQSVGGVAGKGPRDEEARVRLAEAFIEMGEFDRAAETYGGLVRFYPKSARRDAYAFNIGKIHQEHGRDSIAVEEMQTFIVDYPESRLQPNAYFTIGDAYYNLEVFDSAYAYYYQVLDLFPNSAIVPEALDNVRLTLKAMGRGREAVAVIDSFMARNPNRLPADSLVLSKGDIELEAGEYAQAIVHYRELLSGFPESRYRPEALYQIGKAYDYLGQRDSAMLTYDAIVAGFPESPTAVKALADRAQMKLDDGNFLDAATDYELFLERYASTSRAVEARFGLGRARLALTDTAAALKQFQQIVDSSGSEEDVFLDGSRLEMARIFVRRGDRDAALELLASVVARRKDDIAAEALLFRSELLMSVNDLSAALAELRTLTTEFTDYPEYTEPGMFLLGQLYEQLTNYSAARETYTALIAQTENTKLKADAEARLKKLKK